MKKIIYLLSIAFIISIGNVKAAGGPDAYGYTWMTSLDAGGPTFNWVDITTRPGVQTITGLADDNSTASMVNIGFNFHYYWNDYTQLKVGSNGWLSFNNISNIASCFPSIPTAGGAGDNILAPLMGDLNFTGIGNPGQVKYWTNNLDTFIISYINVPFWSVSAPGWIGSNSFQVILCNTDSSITFQYGTLSGFLNNAACIDMTVGIENSTGNIGLQVHSDALPPNNYAIKFDYPSIVLLSIQDITPKWNLNVDNGAVFYPTGTFSMISDIKNAGNTAVTTPISITGNIRDLSNAVIHTASFNIPTLAANDDSIITFTSPTILTPGQYKFETITTNSQDINAGNNTIITEVDLVNVCTSSFVLGYATGGIPDGSVNWNGGANDDGVAVHIVPPVYPLNITNMQVYVSSNVSDGLLAKIYADDGPGGAPGTLLYSGSIAAASIITNAWNTHAITPVTINSGGFYLAFYQTGTTIFIGTESAGPLSRRNYEILDDGWGVYRDNQIEDLLIRASMTNPNSAGPATPGPISGLFDFCTGSEDTLTYSVTPVGGATSYVWSLPAGWNGTSSTNTITTVAGSSGGNISVSASNLCGTSTPSTSLITINALPSVVANATDSSLCQGDSVVLTGSGASSYIWSHSVNDGIGFIPSATVTYTVTGTDVNNCSNTDSVSVVVNTIPTVVANTTNDSVCSGNSITLTGSGANSYIWSHSVNDGIGFVPSGTATYTVTGTDVNNCSNTDSVTVVVNTSPTLVATSSDSILCYGESSSINLSGADTYTWNGSATPASFLFGPTSSTSGVVVATDTVSGCTDTDTLYFIVNLLPVVNFNYAGSDTFCINAGAQPLAGSTPGGGTYSGDGVSGSNFDPNSAGIGTADLYYTYTDANSCTNSDTISLIVIGCAGLEENTGLNISVYPNPFTSTLNISGLEPGDLVQIYDLHGQMLVTWTNYSSSMFNVMPLSSGVYILKIIREDKTITKKIIKE